MGDGDGDGAGTGEGLRTTMERKRILNARQTAMRQRKFQRLAQQKEEEQQRHMKEVLECRRKERARLAAYIHPTAQPSLHLEQVLRMQRAPAKGKPSKPCIVQNQDFAARLRESMKSVVRDSFSRGDPRLLRWRNDELSWDQSGYSQSGSFDEDANKQQSKCPAAKNLRVTFHPATVQETSSGQGPEKQTNDLPRPLSPTIVLDGPDLDSSSNSSHNVEPSPKSECRFSSFRDHQQTSVDDMNTFLEEALKLRLDSETATNRMIAEVTGLDSRLDELHDTHDNSSVNRCSASEIQLKEGPDACTPRCATQLCDTSQYKKDEDMLKEGHKVYRSEAWEISPSDLDDNAEQRSSIPDKDQAPTVSRSSDVDALSKQECRNDNSWSCLAGGETYAQQYSMADNHSHLETQQPKGKSRTADLIALTREESNVLASIERLDWKLASAIARCRDSSLFDGSVHSAPTVMSHARGSSRSTGRTSQSTRSQVLQTSHSVEAGPRRRQNVGLTNKRQGRRYPSSRSASRAETYSQVGDNSKTTVLEARSNSCNPYKEGVIVFHPDAYYLLNPVASP